MLGLIAKVDALTVVRHQQRNGVEPISYRKLRSCRSNSSKRRSKIDLRIYVWQAFYINEAKIKVVLSIIDSKLSCTSSSALQTRLNLTVHLKKLLILYLSYRGNRGNRYNCLDLRNRLRQA